LSRVTDAVIVLAWLDADDALVAQIVGSIPGIDAHQRFRELPFADIDRGAGGPKAMSSRIFLCGFNNIDIAALVDWFAMLPWCAGVDSACLTFDTDGHAGAVFVNAGTPSRAGTAAE
jgi:hypothetical protein